MSSEKRLLFFNNWNFIILNIYDYMAVISVILKGFILFLLIFLLFISILFNAILMNGIREMSELTPERLYQMVLRVEQWGKSHGEEKYRVPPDDSRSVYAMCKIPRGISVNIDQFDDQGLWVGLIVNDKYWIHYYNQSPDEFVIQYETQPLK